MTTRLAALLLAALVGSGCGGSESPTGAGGSGGGAAGHGAGPASGGSGPGTGGSSGDGGSNAGGANTGGTGGSAAGGGGAGTGGSTPTGSQWVLGYYAAYSTGLYPIADIDWSGLSHVAMAPMLVKSGTTLDYTFGQSAQSTTDAKALATAAHAHGVKALLMLGGAGAGPPIKAAANNQNRPSFVTNLLKALDDLGYDGIDLDWEDSVDLDELVALAHDLRAARPSILLSYPAGSINMNIDSVDPKMADLAASLDRFNVQTYSPSTTFAGSGWSSWFSSPISGASGSTPIAIDDTLQRYHAVGIPNAKLGMGIAFYAICYSGGITGPRQATNGTSQKIIGGDNDYPLSKFFAKGSTFDNASAGEIKTDAVAQVPFLSLNQAVNDAGCKGSTQYISYEDETSIKTKGAYSKANGYGGIIIWTIQEGWLPQNAAGGRARNALMQALKEGFLDP